MRQDYYHNGPFDIDEAGFTDGGKEVIEIVDYGLPDDGEGYEGMQGAQGIQGVQGTNGGGGGGGGSQGEQGV